MDVRSFYIDEIGGLNYDKSQFWGVQEVLCGEGLVIEIMILIDANFDIFDILIIRRTMVCAWGS